MRFLNILDSILLQTIQYMAKNRVVQTETRELASLNRGKIKPGETDDWRNEQLYVPPLPPTNLRGCHIIRIQYDVFVSTFHFSCICLNAPYIKICEIDKYARLCLQT